MVCLLDEDHVQIPVIDVIGLGQKKESLVNVTPYKSIESIFTEVAAAFDYTASEIELSLHKGSETHKLNNYKEKTLQEAGLIISNADNATIYIDHHTSSRNMYVCVQEEDDLLLGASASPTTGEQQIAGELPPALMGDYDIYSSQRPNLRPIVTETTNYVGLVNQAMTCYLNSLLQALYMTPEFRNALYNWEFDGQNDTRSIPFQLQKLFLNLQTSSKSAVETTDLTTSFGWQGSDAWHQHDIQELCRVMFDALEQKFKDTKQANLINDLYEGSWLDYVKCLECGTEKSREDTFQDIPLPVRPFGSTVAYNSIEEALRAFVQPETLDGNNQYLCEKCNKKCDAHKGLKFIKFPYLLTLHLKRFDFDYTTMHRIKLNDKVVFPELLNLNSFLCSRNTESESLDEKETAVKCDDCSTTDSGSADDESCQGTDVSSTVNGQDDNCADSDEGIDVNSGNNLNESEAKGPYMYELFSIMIHSGSASGGHYYAYIKDFDKNLWFCFNDQSVTGITEDDIRKSHGGGPQRGYYSGAYSSSTNAYMLMYRQIDSERNCHAITVEEFPPHIRKLLHDMRQKEEEDRKNREKENDMVKLNVFCINPNTNLVQDVKISLFSDSTLADAAQYAHQRLKLDGIARVQDCRIVIYNKKHDCIDCSFESADSKFCDLFSKHQIKVIMIYTDWMLEIKKRGTKWEHYKRGGINMRVYPINLETEEVEDPTVVRVNVEETVRELKTRLSPLVNIQANNIKLVIEMYSNEPKYLDNDDDIVKFDANCTDYKLYVSNALDEDPEKSFKASKLHKVIERYGYIISLTVVLPETDIGTLESQSIPSLDLNQNLDKLDPVSGPGTNSPNLKVSPQPGVGLCGDGFGDQSNSEDSSLSDSDRTLVGEAPGECMALLSSNSNSPSDQHMASPSDGIEEAIPYNCGFADQTSVMQWDDEETQRAAQRCYYFKVTKIVNNGKSKNPADVSNNIYMKWCKILVDKRMTLERFKKNLELVVRVPSEYFKIFRQYPNSDDEWSSLTDTLRSAKDGERLLVKLGRVLRKDELDCRVYLLNPDSSDAECKKSSSYLFEHIITKGQTVASVKKEILIQLKKQCMKDIPYNECRLREKSWRTPRRVYFDDQKFNEDINVTPNFDIYLQELGCVDTVTSSNQLVLFVRRWCPSTMTLKPFQEVVLDVATMDELKTKLSPLSEIPVENLEVALMKPAFPCDVHLLDIHSELDWNPNVSSIDQWPVRAEDGSTFFYRDNREALKEITQEEKAEINQRENTRLGRISSKSHYSYSPGRERALKIYLDPSPSKPEDNCVD